MAEAGQSAEPLRQLDHRRMREAREHHMVEPFQLVGNGGLQMRVAMAEEVNPPRADGVEIALTLVVVEPDTLRTCDGQRRQRLVLLHLRARVPHGAQAALAPARDAVRHGSIPSAARLRPGQMKKPWNVDSSGLRGG
jgi:hypothetical protein